MLDGFRAWRLLCAALAVALAVALAGGPSPVSAQAATQTFYFAEGFVRGDAGRQFLEVLNLANFSAQTGTATAVYTFQTGPALTRTYDVPAGRTFCVTLFGTTPQLCAKESFESGKEVSVKVTTPLGWVADRQMFFDSSGWTGGHEQVGTVATARTWYFAEGTTLAPFEEYLTIQNPDEASDAQVAVDYLTDCGRNRTQNVTVNRLTRFTIVVKDQVGEGCTGVSAVVQSNVPIVVERPLYFLTDFGGALSPRASDGHDVFGVNQPSGDWFFAEGTTLGGFREFLALGNPGDVAATATLHYVFTGGKAPLDKVVIINPRSRTTVQVYNPSDAGGVGEGIEGVSVHVESNVPILAERPMYMSRVFPNGAGGIDFLVTGGHDAVGARAAGTTFSFAGASTQTNRAAYLTIQNALGTDAQISLTYIGPSRSLGTGSITVPARSRGNVVLFDASRGGLSTPEPSPIGIQVVSTSPVLVEQPSYFNFGTFDGATNVVGFTPPQAPTAVLSGSPLAGFAPLDVTFNGSQSSDEDGAIASWRLSFGDATADATGAASPPAQLVHRYANPGSYTATLTVTDDTDRTGSASLAIIVTNPNLPPAASLIATPLNGAVPLLVRFNGSGSSDPNGDLASWTLSFGDGAPAATGSGVPPMQVDHTYTSIGTYTATLTVTDTTSLSDSDSAVINVMPDPAPTALLSPTVASGNAPLGVNFDASGSFDPGGSISSWMLDFGDFTTPDGGPGSPPSNISHVYWTEGDYEPTLTVTDSIGQTDMMTAAITAAASWASHANLPTPRWGAAVVEGPDDLIYVIGGSGPTGSITSTVDAYDPETNTWQAKAPLPTPRTDLGAGVAGDGLIYAVGGFNGAAPVDTVDVLDVFDGPMGSWSAAPSLLTPTAEHAVIEAPDGSIKVIGGLNQYGLAINFVEFYDPVGAPGAWQVGTPLPGEPRRNLAGAIDLSTNSICVVGGIHSGAPFDTFECLDGAWVTKPPLPAPRHSLAAATSGADGRLYAIGGIGLSGFPSSQVDAWNPYLPGWEPVPPLLIARWLHGADGAQNGRIYVFGGRDGMGNATDSVVSYG